VEECIFFFLAVSFFKRTNYGGGGRIFSFFLKGGLICCRPGPNSFGFFLNSL